MVILQSLQSPRVCYLFYFEFTRCRDLKQENNMCTLDLKIINKIICQDIYNPSNWPCRATAFHLLSSVLIWLYRQTCLLLFKLLLFPPCPSTCCPHCLPCQELSIRTLIFQYTGASNERTTCTASILEHEWRDSVAAWSSLMFSVCSGCLCPKPHKTASWKHQGRFCQLHFSAL